LSFFVSPCENAAVFSLQRLHFPPFFLSSCHLTGKGIQERWSRQRKTKRGEGASQRPLSLLLLLQRRRRRPPPPKKKKKKKKKTLAAAAAAAAPLLLLLLPSAGSAGQKAAARRRKRTK